ETQRTQRNLSVTSVLLTCRFCARREDFSLTVLARSLHRESFSPAVFAGVKVPKADEGAALGRSRLRNRALPALRVSLFLQEDVGRGTLDRKVLGLRLCRAVSLWRNASYMTG